MPIDFPNSPTIGQTYVVDDRGWIWDGSVWKSQTLMEDYSERNYSNRFK
jgi:hypothetical protein